ncbi:hypothetical protein ACFLRP_01140 [Bacteroidota bacterium]
MNINRGKLYAFLNLFGFLGMVVVNALATTLPINNKSTGALSDQYPNLFVPAGLTFSIWGVIYLLLAMFVVYSLITTFRNTQEKVFVEKIGIFFLISCLVNIGWIFAWHYELVALSLLLMLILLASLLTIYLRFNIGKSSTTRTERYAIHLPFSIYLGWITIATIANATALLVDIGWNAIGLSEQFWAIAVIAVGIGIALAVLFRRNDIFFGLVVDWALLGILLKRLADNTIPDQGVVVVTIVGLALISAAIALQIFRGRVYQQATS